MANLALVARQIIGSPKIILAADESGNEEKPGTIGRRLDSIGVPCTNANIHAYRRMLFSAQVGHFVGGAILARDTLACRELVDLLVAQGIAPGIKIDEGLDPYGDIAGEQVVKGFQDVEGRLARPRGGFHKVQVTPEHRGSVSFTQLHRSQCSRSGSVRS